MGNIINDIVEEIEIKPNKSKLYIKWIISIAGSLIALAFVFGQFKSSFFNRMDKFEDALNKNTASIERMETKMDENFVEVNTRIDKGYDDGLEILTDYQEFNKKQLILVLDYGQTNKELLKEMLEINMQEKARSVENQVNQARNENINIPYKGEGEAIAIEEEKGRDFSIAAVPMKDKPFISEVFFIEVESQDTTFNITGATQEYVNSIDTNKYELGAVIGSDKYPNRYDFSYRKKR
jgi:hypothetical protein